MTTTDWGRCLECGETAVGEIAYGMMTYEDFLELGPGVIMGGCCVGDAVTRCTNCEQSWDAQGAPARWR